ncbi:hydroxymethylbilane synthase [Methanoplanus sp. FWC-SCC4]|uniref:Hydroxymethylbilane synthase n=1 Tax=Methanochimaera problematica TaxID=2609417 RepID=A0AA97FAM0_9EURY|nr:hydroxymethylbilane synthase [Methanoplanus sp. FWC-SCC4]WOF15890.1 hydroxymethylbilane synthase [Methanoplanus sp. FWC-SCC4]
MPLKLGTRGSRLAMAQTERVCKILAEKGIDTEIVIIKTVGDDKTDVPLHKVGGQGIFVRALDDAIITGEVDFAVHSMKDIPAQRPTGVTTCAVLERDSPADFLVHECPLEEIKIIGTSSTRRTAQLKRGNLNAEIKELRGNVDTRLRKLREGEYDAIVLAEAGMQRLSMDLPGTRLLCQWYVPSPNQGTIAVVCRDDPELVKQLSVLDHPQTRIDTEVERAVMEEIGGGCFTPQGVYCKDGFLIAEVLSLDGKRWERIEDNGESIEEGHLIGQKLRGMASDLIEEARQNLGI